MAFTLTDLIEKLGSAARDGRQSEYMAGEVASIKPASREEVLKLFPDEKLVEDGSVAYLPVRMCHSIPSKNKKGRAFLPAVLSRSCASARDSLINYEHRLVHNQTSADDVIVGHMKAARFDPENVLLQNHREVANYPKIPLVAAPMYALAALFLRHSLVPDIIKDHLSGCSWATSMECDHDWRESCFLYENDLIPVRDAPPGMLECVERNRVRDYKERPLAICLGGETGSVNFWGLGMTQRPADKDAEVLSILTASPMEMASEDETNLTRKKTFLPLRIKKIWSSVENVELAHDAVDTQMKELASVEVLGKTKPADDGHAHEILSDGTILPAQNHIHSVANYSLVKATTPRYTGRTDTHYFYPPQVMNPGGVMVGGGESIVHMHTFDIPLRGKKAADAESASLLETDLDVLGSEVSMKLKDLLARLDAAGGRLSTGKPGEAAPEVASVQTEIANIRKELSEGAMQEMIADAVKLEIANEVTAGNLVPKAKVEEVKTAAVTAAVTEETKKFEEARKQAELKTKRLELINGLGIDLASKPYEDDVELTVAKRLEAITLDDAGEKEFKLEFRFLKTLADLAKAEADKIANANKTEEEKVKLKEAEEAAEKARLAALNTPALASTGTGTPGKLLLVGAGRGKSAPETAATGAGSNGAAVPGNDGKNTAAAKKTGRFAFSK